MGGYREAGRAGGGWGCWGGAPNRGRRVSRESTAAQGRGGCERPPYKRAGGKRPKPGGSGGRGVRHPRKGRRPNREGAGLRGVAAGVNARPTGGREVRGRDREGAAAGGTASAEGQAAEPGDCRTARGRGGRERPPYRWAGGKRPGPGSAAAGGAASAEGRAIEPEVAGRRRVAAGVNARPTGGWEVSGRGRESASAGGAASAEGRAAEPGSCQAARGRGGRERPPYKWAGGERPGPGERRLRGEGGRGMWVTVDREGAAAGGGEVAALTDKGDSLWGKASGRAGRVQRRRMWRDVCIQNIYFVAAKTKRRKETQAKTIWKQLSPIYELILA